MVRNTMPKIIAMTIETALFACGLWGVALWFPACRPPEKQEYGFDAGECYNMGMDRRSPKETAI